jgi:hypothetical protein
LDDFGKRTTREWAMNTKKTPALRRRVLELAAEGVASRRISALVAAENKGKVAHSTILRWIDEGKPRKAPQFAPSAPTDAQAPQATDDAEDARTRPARVAAAARALGDLFDANEIADAFRQCAVELPCLCSLTLSAIGELSFEFMYGADPGEADTDTNDDT